MATVTAARLHSSTLPAAVRRLATAKRIRTAINAGPTYAVFSCRLPGNRRTMPSKAVRCSLVIEVGIRKLRRSAPIGVRCGMPYAKT